jgi:hypothetical protein
MTTMRNATRMLCVLLLAVAPVAPMHARASEASEDAAVLMRYVLKLFNASASITTQLRTMGLPGEQDQIAEAARGRFDVDTLGTLLGPVLVAQVPAPQIHECAAAVRLSESAALLAAVPVSEDAAAALRGLPPAQQQTLLSLISRPCMATVVKVISSPDAHAVAGQYGRSLVCDAVRDDETALQILRDAGHCAP